MSRFTDAELYLRGSDTLLASWEAYACGAPGAAVKRFPGVAAALFPGGPERAVYNNALLQRDLGPGDRAEALNAMETAYSAAVQATPTLLSGIALTRRSAPSTPPPPATMTAAC